MNISNVIGQSPTQDQAVTDATAANLGKEDFIIARGDRIAQMVVAKVEQIVWEEVDAVGKSERGAGGFGHTGTQ